MTRLPIKGSKKPNCSMTCQLVLFLTHPTEWLYNAQCTIHNAQCTVLFYNCTWKHLVVVLLWHLWRSRRPRLWWSWYPRRNPPGVATGPSDWQLPPLTSTWHTSTADNLPRLEQEEGGFQTHLLQKAWSKMRSAYMDRLLNFKPVLYSLKLIFLALFFKKISIRKKNKCDTLHLTHDTCHVVGDEHSLKMQYASVPEN